MSIIIGEKLGSDFSNPIGLLTDCHRRIEKFLDVLHKVARQSSGGPLDDEHRQAVEVALRYFNQSAPKHTADEEESLFPRMLARAGSQLSLFSAVLDRLNADHRSITGEHERVDELGRSWLAHEFLQPQETTQLVTIIEDLKDVYVRHIAIEERDIFPFALNILPADELRSIANEMAGRRNLPMKNLVVSGIGPR